MRAREGEADHRPHPARRRDCARQPRAFVRSRRDGIAPDAALRLRDIERLVVRIHSARLTDLDERRKALRDLLEDHWEYVMRTQPEFASILGDKRYNDRSGDFSPAALASDAQQMRHFLGRAERIGIAGFGEQELLDHELFVLLMRNNIEDYESREWEMPVNQISGIHLFAAQFPVLLTFTTAKDYDDYVTRLRNFPKQIDDTIEAMKLGVRDGLMP